MQLSLVVLIKGHSPRLETTNTYFYSTSSPATSCEEHFMDNYLQNK